MLDFCNAVYHTACHGPGEHAVKTADLMLLSDAESFSREECFMRYPEYADDLQRIHASEVYGVALFDTAARLTPDAERTRKWLALKALDRKGID